MGIVAGLRAGIVPMEMLRRTGRERKGLNRDEMQRQDVYEHRRVVLGLRFHACGYELFGSRFL